MKASVRILLSVLLFGVLASSAAIGAQDVDAAVRISQVGPPGFVVRDMTPDGRYLLLGSVGEKFFRVDRVTGARVRVPFDGFLAANGRAVIGNEHSSLLGGHGRVVRFDIPTRTRTRFRLSGEVTDINNRGTRVAVVVRSFVGGLDRAFVLNTRTGRWRRLDLGVPGRAAAGTGEIGRVVLSADGSVAAFDETHPAGCTRCADVFVWSAATGAIRLASPSVAGRRTGTGDSTVESISGDGRLVVFRSNERHLVSGVSTRTPHFYLRNAARRRTTLLPFRPSGDDTVDAVISDNGRRIAFPIRDRHSGHDVVGFLNRRTGRRSDLMATTDGNPPSGGLSLFTRLAMDGRGTLVAFASYATNLVVGTTTSNDRSYVVTT